MKTLGLLRTRWAASLALLVCAILAPLSSAHTRTTDVTWEKDVSHIVQTRCGYCHAPGKSAQLRLDTYQAARAESRAIREMVLEGRMPPWPAVRGLGDFSNDRSLTPVELELLTAWADGNAPLGKADDTDDTARSPVELEPRTPDRVIVVPAGHPEQGQRVERLEVMSEAMVGRWVTGWSFRPGNPLALERAVVSIIGGEPLGSWSPGDGVIRFPRGVAQRVPGSARFAIELHYRKSMAPSMPRSWLELFEGPPPSAELRHRVLACGSNGVPADSQALTITPAGSAGQPVEVVVRRPDQSVEAMVAIPEFEPAEHLTYRFRRPVRLPRGTWIDVRSPVSGCTADLEFIVPKSSPAVGR
jgi:hypothetical protein